MLDIHSFIAWLQTVVSKGAVLRQSSQLIQKGDVFFACHGSKKDGREFIEQAVEQGAVAVLLEENGHEAFQESIRLLETWNVPYRMVKNLKQHLSAIAAHWYDHPSQKMTVIGVSGTNGKTSTTQWIAKILDSGGERCGVIGTLGAFFPDGSKIETGLTTPDALTLQYILYRLHQQGAAYATMEVSSIGLEEGRLDHISLGIVAITNITQDHLDYHQTMENYIQAKARLFHWQGVQTIIGFMDCPITKELLQHSLQTQPEREHVGYTLSPEPTAMPALTVVKGTDVISAHMGMVFNLHLQEGTVQVSTHLVGLHNVANLLLVASVLKALGWSETKIAGGLMRAQPIPGRLEPVLVKQGYPFVLVDYAHTADALQRSLEAMRPIAQARQGKLWVVFGCGGQRDTSKRPIMGKVAVEYADQVILTSDNPRNENPQTIIEDILQGIEHSQNLHVSVERARAIVYAIMQAQPNDVVLIAGKGHEAYQEIADKRLPFSDLIQARLALRQYPSIEKSTDLMRLNDAAIHMGGVVACADEYNALGFSNVSTDTRSLQAGDLFFALSGENFDGQDFVLQAYQNGAIAAVVSKPIATLSSFPQIVVQDPLHALAKLAQAWRRSFHIPVIGIVGSNGKTTTKEMLANVLKTHYGEDGVLYTQGNYNNEIGVPLTIMSLRKSHKVAVVEMGMNHPGEIKTLAEIAQPTMVIMTNAQREHQEFMHSVEAVARENGDAISALPADGVAIYPLQLPYAHLWQEISGNRQQYTFGLTAEADVFAQDIYSVSMGSQYQVITRSVADRIMLAVPGAHNIVNSLAVYAAASALQVPHAKIVEGLETFQPASGRMQTETLATGSILINDTYNANPDSVRAAIDVLAQMSSPRVLVLGDMGEVGADADAVHAEVGTYAAEKGIEKLFALGEKTLYTAQAFGENGQHFTEMDALIKALESNIFGAVLIKGSRFMRMERVVQAIKKHID